MSVTGPSDTEPRFNAVTTAGHFWLSAQYTARVGTGAAAPNIDAVSYISVVQVVARRTSPICAVDN
eukprot:scaffold470630_cov48-Prasinocladus_malaysianus.AAC.1